MQGPFTIDGSRSASSGLLRRWRVWVACGLGALGSATATADPLVEAETRVTQVRSTYGLTGKGVAVAILDRGIDWRHADFRNADGSTRIAYIYDLSDDSGARAANNPYGVGTVYSAAQINAALNGGTVLPTRDAVGHGTATAGNCCGNGRASNGRYVGVAPESTLIVVKFTSEGAPAHGSQAAEAPFYNADHFPKAVDFATAKARELGMPLVMLANFGSIGDRADGSDAIAQKIDAVVGPGKPGVVFLTGAGDDGGMNNHAQAVVASGQTRTLRVQKGSAGEVLVQLWYRAGNRFNVSLTTPTASFGPYVAPADNAFDLQTTPEFTYGHNGAVYYGNTWRLVYLRLTGPTGIYTLGLTGATVTNGGFHANLGGAHYGTGNVNQFLDAVVSSGTIWSGATARYNIAPNSYVFRTSWQGLDGGNYTVSNQGAVGDLWVGSSIGPTWDGRTGIDFSAPGERTITTYAPDSWWATFRANQVADGAGQYGIASAVSAAAPVATGAIALLLQRNPRLDAATVKSTLQRTARRDTFTGSTPNTRFGHGKLDVLAAVAATTPLPVPTAVSNCLFDWAERSFPQFFSPRGAASGVLADYYYRFYSAAGNYLATSPDGHLVVIGASTNNQLIDAGLVTDFQSLAACPG